MSLLSIRNLDLDINGKEILRDISLDIEQGKILGVIGESGSGKSMTAYSVMQLLPRGSRSSGSIKLDGHEVIGASEETMCGLRGDKVGMVFQEPASALNPVLTIGQQVAETILIHGKVNKAEAMRIAAEALERAELPQDQFPLSRYPHELSGGQRQRVVIAMAIALRPKLLIADEPTTALDVTTQAQILNLLRRLVREDNMGLMLISHDLAVVSDMADTIAIMKSGRIVEQGPAKTVFSKTEHPYTKALLAASSHVPDREEIDTCENSRLLEVSNVVRDYPTARKSFFGKRGKFRAVDHVSFHIDRGESLGLVGESGCGKSTLVRAILGLEPLQGGEIQIDGMKVLSGQGLTHAVRRKVQVVFQDPYGSFNPRHRVDRLVSEPMHLLEDQPTSVEREEMVISVLESVGLEGDDRFKYIHEFSGGQRQRIAIARALIIKPELIVLDEAVSALDVSIRAQILDLLAELSDRFNLSYLFISHDLSVVRSITERVLVMQSGKIVEHGDTEKIFSAPEQSYTRALIDAIPKLPALKKA